MWIVSTIRVVALLYCRPGQRRERFPSCCHRRRIRSSCPLHTESPDRQIWMAMRSNPLRWFPRFLALILLQYLATCHPFAWTSSSIVAKIYSIVFSVELSSTFPFRDVFVLPRPFFIYIKHVSSTVVCFVSVQSVLIYASILIYFQSVFLRFLLLRTAFQGRPPSWEGDRRGDDTGPAVRGAAGGKEGASGVRGRGGRSAGELINAKL